LLKNNLDIPTIRIFVITYRRPILLKRALNSLLNQSYKNWTAEVINDDPDELSVEKLINEIADSRIALSLPSQKRGGTGNFNYAFSHQISEPYACILEDDNWYEETFLHEMLTGLRNKPEVKLAVSNERIWIEKINGDWIDTETTIWPTSDPDYFFNFRAIQKCGDAKICNSSMFWKTGTFNWLTPASIPIDVTEHFRERVIPHPILIITKPLVNFAVTLKTSRVKNSDWSVYQALLVSSVFENSNKKDRQKLAEDLWKKARTKDQYLQTTLFNASLVSKSAILLFKLSNIGEKFRYLLTVLKKPKTTLFCMLAKKTKSESWMFLTTNQSFEG